MCLFVQVTADDSGMVASDFATIPLTKTGIKTVLQNVTHRSRIPLTTFGSGGAGSVQLVCDPAHTLAGYEIGKDAFDGGRLVVGGENSIFIVIAKPIRAAIVATFRCLLHLARHHTFVDLLAFPFGNPS